MVVMKMNITKHKIFMGEEVDILEIFFEALSTPKNSIVIEMLSNDGAENLTENRFSGKIAP